MFPLFELVITLSKSQSSSNSCEIYKAQRNRKQREVSKSYYLEQLETLYCWGFTAETVIHSS